MIAQDEAQAREALEGFLVERRFGDGQVFVEEHLTGEELSLLALCDGERAVPLAPAQDFKRIFDGDEGPNTGGMGSYSPVPGAGDPHELAAVVHQPLVDELRRRGTPFHGVLYAGLDAHRGRPAGHRVQRALRRPGDAGGPAPAARRPARPAAPRGHPRRPRGRTARVLGRRRRDRRARERGLPGVVLERGRHRGAGRRARRRRGDPRRHRAAGGRRHRHRGRAGAQRDGSRRRHRRRPGRRLCCRRPDHLRGPAAAHATSRCGPWGGHDRAEHRDRGRDSDRDGGGPRRRPARRHHHGLEVRRSRDGGAARTRAGPWCRPVDCPGSTAPLAVRQ